MSSSLNLLDIALMLLMVMIGSSRVVEARNANTVWAVLRSGNGFGAMREGSHDADVAGSEFHPLS